MISIPSSLDDWTVERITDLLQAHVYEDVRLDWKEDVPSGAGDRIGVCAAAMANGDGGFIVIGVADSRALGPRDRLKGVDATRDLTQQIGEVLKNADPAIPHRFRNPPLSLPANPGRVIVVLEILSGIGPHAWKGIFYARSASSARAVSTREVQGMFTRREELLRRVRMLVLELVSAREAALGIYLVNAARKTSFLRSIDTRVLAELHAEILPFLADDEGLSADLTVVRGQADVLNFRVQSVLPLFLRSNYTNPNFDVFIEAGLNSDSHRLADALAKIIARLCARAGMPEPKLLADHELRDRGAF